MTTMTMPLVLFWLVISTSTVAVADEISGTASIQPSGCPISGLTVEIDPEIGSSQIKVFTTTDRNGYFVARVMSGNYLIIVSQQGTKVFQSTIHLRGTYDMPINLTTANSVGLTPCANSKALENDGNPIHFRANTSWRPSDLALDSDGTFLILDDSGGVSRISRARSAFNSVTLFTLPPYSKPESVASNSESIFATAERLGGCVLYIYDKNSKILAPHAFGNRACSGVAASDHKLYLYFDRDQGVEVFDPANFSSHSVIPLASSTSPVTLALDDHANELFAGDSAGSLYAVPSDNKPRKVTKASNAINSIGIGVHLLLLATDDGLVCYDRSSNKIKPLVQCLPSKPRGVFTGVRIDTSQNAWLSDSQKNDFSGPYAAK